MTRAGWPTAEQARATNSRKGRTPTAPPAETALALKKVNHDELTRMQRSASEQLQIALDGTIDNDFELQEVNDWKLEISETIKRLESQRQSIVGPMNAAKKAVQDVFMPPINGWKKVVAELNAKIGAYQLACDEASRAAYQETAESVTELSHEELSEQLAAAADLAPMKLAGTACKFRWAIKRINMTMLTDDWKLINTAKIEEYADRFGDEEPIIPGVIWERVPDVRATGRR